jgi:hypothetical protein
VSVWKCGDCGNVFGPKPRPCPRCGSANVMIDCPTRWKPPAPEVEPRVIPRPSHEAVVMGTHPGFAREAMRDYRASTGKGTSRAAAKRRLGRDERFADAEGMCLESH